jgi:hypothetical protein
LAAGHQGIRHYRGGGAGQVQFEEIMSSIYFRLSNLEKVIVEH